MILRADSPPPAGIPRSLDRIGDHLRRARIERGLEQKDLAILLGVTESCIWLWENHWSAPPVPRCKRLIDFLGYGPFPATGDVFGKAHRLPPPERLARQGRRDKGGRRSVQLVELGKKRA